MWWKWGNYVPLVSRQRHGVEADSSAAPCSRTPQEQKALKREIEATDNQIGGLVNELYGLTEEEIKIVEGK